MKPRRETLWNAEANRWNIGKFIVGIYFFTCAARASLAMVVLVGPVNFPNAFPAITAHPLQYALWYGAMAALLVFVFDWLERARRRNLPPDAFSA